jgi:hypothetical protein
MYCFGVYRSDDENQVGASDGTDSHLVAGLYGFDRGRLDGHASAANEHRRRK